MSARSAALLGYREFEALLLRLEVLPRNVDRYRPLENQLSWGPLNKWDLLLAVEELAGEEFPASLSDALVSLDDWDHFYCVKRSHLG